MLSKSIYGNALTQPTTVGLSITFRLYQLLFQGNGQNVALQRLTISSNGYVPPRGFHKVGLLGWVWPLTNITLDGMEGAVENYLKNCYGKKRESWVRTIRYVDDAIICVYS
eukprot:TRINITY_DN1758_c0_g2_i1.p13 TRINITY_DN1758_c0_g2~~TRINITY_DN1758_c0_g2_i1.p13  ORF type:complete len:111 (+),score=4.33 TRINITY_DN1758_c0_g2_i1:696-1028(+)